MATGSYFLGGKSPVNIQPSAHLRMCPIRTELTLIVLNAHILMELKR